MDLLFQSQAIAGLLALAFLYSIWAWTARSKINIKGPPEPPGAWPIIGHLHLLASGPDPCRTLAALADRYGPAFVLRLGVNLTLVVSTWEAAKECFTTHDVVLANRPSSAVADNMGYDYAMFGFAPYGQYWREIRKMVTVQLLSNRRLELIKHIQVDEINTCVKELYGRWVDNHERPVTVEMSKTFFDLTFNVIGRMIVGKRFFGYQVAHDNAEAARVREVMKQSSYLNGVFVVSDALPFLKWMDLQGHVRAMKRTAKELDSLLSRWLDDHRRRMRSDGGDDVGEQDFMDAMLTVLERDPISSYDTDTIIKATTLILIAAGSDSTVVTLTWAISLLLNNRHSLKRAQDELDTHVGRDRNVDGSDTKNLMYIQAIVKETLRLYPAAPFGIPHKASEDFTICGFHVPAGTTVMVNLWKLQRDPRVWSDPCEFQPERFLTSHANVDVRGQHFELIPFGAGRRYCPGISLALPVLHLTLARLLHGFELATPSDAPVDMAEKLNITINKANPLEVVLTPRLPPKLYE
ncbi:cytochrome P450 CYP82D47-like [Magnolia sinica]|uniref:cytochrome P450 CYP82D47-like n=1 Tax=Magnolia sinica TaxID=86752 RepID=UPI00265AB203|nr:cytochrome P450 CYP82D47-like [Magnolia sinica]